MTYNVFSGTLSLTLPINQVKISLLVRSDLNLFSSKRRQCLIAVCTRVASMTPRTLHALKLLRLDRLYSGCFLKLNTTTRNLLRVAEPYVTWG